MKLILVSNRRPMLPLLLLFNKMKIEKLHRYGHVRVTFVLCPLNDALSALVLSLVRRKSQDEVIVLFGCIIIPEIDFLNVLLRLKQSLDAARKKRKGKKKRYGSLLCLSSAFTYSLVHLHDISMWWLQECKSCCSGVSCRIVRCCRSSEKQNGQFPHQPVQHLQRRDTAAPARSGRACDCVRAVTLTDL